jgi:uncharacterized protein
MRATVNIRHLEDKPLQLKDELTVKEMDIDPMDDLIELAQPLRYDLVVQLIDRGVLAQGKLELELRCACSRCLSPYVHTVQLDNWVCHLPLEGEDQVEVVHDQVDLTPFIREDIVLAFPQQPLCEQECKGLSRPPQDEQERGRRESEAAASAWAELNKLKLS